MRVLQWQLAHYVEPILLASMAFLPSLSTKELQRYHRVVTRSVEVRSHFDVLAWLQGDMQRYLPHDILIAAWGNFQKGAIHHDIISPLAGVRSQTSNAETVTPLLLNLFERWIHFGKKPFALNAGESGFLMQDTGLQSEVGAALQKMHSAMVHGIIDERGSHDCLYVAFSNKDKFRSAECSTMAVVLPYIDTALRQVTHLPHQSSVQPGTQVASTPASVQAEFNLSQREAEILHWVSQGKTNLEIALILHISSFTVKNHMQRVFQKLNVTNRAQAVSKLMPLASNAEN
jgi:transcriptional regulator EpsA